ncbi:hypothetical protein OG552_34715 [Streptomyces sp. NBC_01476]|uniref:hypothetical protein n=1 Tax=Streptomyces sp. NBC_01476 TaxID=2903881 RepID=UPI002E2F4EDA|nr:hypothetical protein [Streptomyces sp. NBC_01476]
MDVVAYRERGRVAVEISGVIDLPCRDAVARALRSHVEACEETELVVRLHHPLVTASTVHVLCAMHDAAVARGLALRVVVDPLAVKIFTVLGLDFLLGPGHRCGG